ncbi:MAG: alpha/beta hydrolase [Paucibacter sp.]|nr:alpha/beta hydrolase [Roseateles sp.]
MTRTLVFSHANGFPAGTYCVLFEIWRQAGWQVHALPQFGHDPAYPVASNWRALRDQLIRYIEHDVRPEGPVMLVGHSLGGILSLLAACRRPELAAGLVMIDSPVVDGWRAHSMQVVKAIGLLPRISPGKISSRRRYEWPDRAAVHAHFAAKSKFARWDARVLADYVKHGFEERNGKTVLKFRREVETRIYNTLPHHLGALLQRHPPRCPIGFIAGTQSEELRQAGVHASRRLARKHFLWMEGSHLFPFERPDDTAAAVLQLLEALAVESASL